MNRLKQLREEKNLSLAGLSEELKKQNIKIGKASLSNYERGEQSPKQETWEKLANFFRVDIQFLMGLSPVRNKAENMMYERSLSNLVELVESNHENVHIIRQSISDFSSIMKNIENNNDVLNSFKEILDTIFYLSSRDIDYIVFDEDGRTLDHSEMFKNMLEMQETIHSNVNVILKNYFNLIPDRINITIDASSLFSEEEVENMFLGDSYEEFFANEKKKEELRKKAQERIQENIQKIKKKDY